MIREEGAQKSPAIYLLRNVLVSKDAGTKVRIELPKARNRAMKCGKEGTLKKNVCLRQSDSAWNGVSQAKGRRQAGKQRFVGSLVPNAPCC